MKSPSFKERAGLGSRMDKPNSMSVQKLLVPKLNFGDLNKQSGGGFAIRLKDVQPSTERQEYHMEN